MARNLWDRFMIAMMAIVIFVCAQEVWQSPAPLGETRCLVAIGLAVGVILLKAHALRKTESDGKEESSV